FTHQQFGVDLTDGFGTGQYHCDPQLFFVQFQQLAHPRLTISCQRVDKGAAEHGAVGAERQHTNDVQTCANTRVDQNLQVTFNRIGNRRQRSRAGQYAIELTAAVVGYHYTVGTKAHRIAGVFRIENALDHHRAVPEVTNPLQIFPGDGRIEVGTQP